MRGYEEPLRQSLTPKEAESGITEIRSFFESTISWDKFSDSVITTISTICGNELLDKVQVTLDTNPDLTGLPKTDLNKYAACYSDAMGHVQSEAVFAIAGESRQASIFRKYENAISKYQRISPIITTEKIEDRYRELIETAISMRRLQTEIEFQSASTSFESILKRDSSVIHFVAYPAKKNRAEKRENFSYYISEKPSSTSCSGHSPELQRGLIRCTWNIKHCDKDNVIKYTRDYDADGEKLTVIIEFDYKELLRIFS